MLKNQYGKTWWGQQFLQSLNAIDYDNRLPRGRSYANNGSVISLSINENHIVAKVSGSRPKPYQVEIVIPPFFDPQAANFINNKYSNEWNSSGKQINGNVEYYGFFKSWVFGFIKRIF